MNKGKAFIHTVFSNEAKEILRKYLEIKHDTSPCIVPLPHNKLLREAMDVDVLIVHRDKVTKDILEAAEKLKIIGTPHGGYVDEFIDIKEATKRGVPVIYTPGRNAEAVADFTFGLILALARHIVRADAVMRKSGWFTPFTWDEYQKWGGPELFGKTIGIIGFGNIGMRVAIRAKGFGMNIIVYDPYVPEEKIEMFGAKPVDFETLLKNSDFVTIHVKLTSETKGMIGAKEISLMKPTSFLINTARADIVDKRALYEALKNRKIAGAALDVHWKEPLSSDDPFLRLDNVILTPHIAGDSPDVIRRHSLMIARDVERFLKGKRPLHVINPEVFRRR